MAEYLWDPRPSVVHVAEIIDPSWSYQVDSGYEVRRSKHSRPRHRWTLEYLGLDVGHLRVLRDFIQFARLSAMDIQWRHPTAMDKLLCSPTTPVTIGGYHGMVTGQWMIIFSSPNPSLNNQAWQVTRYDGLNVFLNGSHAEGIAGLCDAQLYVPHAKIVSSSEGTFPAPATLIGPEQFRYDGARSGYYSMTVQIEETF